MGKKIFIAAAVLALGVILGLIAVRYKDRVMPARHAFNKAAPSIESQQPASTKPLTEFAAIVRATGPSVVSISAMGSSYEGSGAKGRPYEELGAGVAVSASGHVATSAHLVSGAESITVTTADRRAYAARIVGVDAQTDLAVIKFDGPVTAASWADSDRAHVGDYVLAVGNPFGLEQTVTLGIISARGRARIGTVEEEFIQTDAAINPGNSGGPLLDASGAVVGMVTGAYPQTGAYPGIGFAVPSNTARLVVDALVREGRLRRGWIGAQAQDLTPELAGPLGYKPPDAPSGVVLTDITPGGPAHGAGLQRGDIIVTFGDAKLESSSALGLMVAQAAAGTKQAVTLYRGGRKYSAELQIAQSPDLAAGAASERGQQERRTGGGPMWGVAVVQLTEDIARQLGLRAEDRYGVVIASVAEGSPAARAGLKRGDVIQSVAERKVSSTSEFTRATATIKSSAPVLLFINRGATGMFYAVLSAS